ncbi:MAG: IspD/TarI family cytidylyltransferase [Victivallaceae bacterium]|nr:IspD/TarI family cytidylyltransferase [Victivallaceae bacterium]
MSTSERKIWHLIVPAAGSAARFGKDKLFCELQGRPLFTHVLARYGKICPGRVLLVVPEEKKAVFGAAVEEFCPELHVELIPGGATRTESVQHALSVLEQEPTDDLAVVQDAARPYSSLELLERCLAEVWANQSGAVPGKAVRDSLKRTGGDGRTIVASVAREDLWAVETPQVFALGKLRHAYQTLTGQSSFTDDAGVMQFAGEIVTIVPSPGENRKITYPEDL